MDKFPEDFPVPTDQGGPGQGQPIGGFGGNLSKKQSEHRAVVQSIRKAPVLLIHGNGGSADSGQWDMLDLKRMLMNAGYPEELIWAPSYLGTGTPDLQTPHTNNINEVREFIENVGEYLDVDVVDIIAHSLGCTLAYAVLRGLIKQTTPIKFEEPKKWEKVGTFVSLAGAFHGLGKFSVGEWITGGEYMKKLLAEDLGGNTETPFGDGKPPTPPREHNITYFCGIARGDFIDAQNRDTGLLEGAINRVYNLGSGTVGHERVKENQVVFDDFFPYLNSVPPVPPVIIEVDKEQGEYNSPLTIPVHVNPPDKAVNYVAQRITKEYQNGFIINNTAETLEGNLNDGQTLTLATDGQWSVVFSADGAAEFKRTYWIGVKRIEVEIITDNETPFEGSLVLEAKTTRGELYHSFNAQMWNLGANTTINETTEVYFLAIDSNGIASDIVSKPFRKVLTCEQTVTANATEHFIAGRIDVNEYLTYFQKFSLTPFTLCLVNGEWVLNPETPLENFQPPTVTSSVDSGRYNELITVTLSARAPVDPSPKIYYTTDGSRPTTSSPFFTSSGKITFDTGGVKTLKYLAQDSSGNSTDVETKTYELNIQARQPVIKVRNGEPQPGEYSQALTTTIEAMDDRDERVTVYYTRDGSIPDENSPSFQDSKEFEISGNGNHAITCYGKDSRGNETYQTFYYAIDDLNYPETGVAPSRGGIYVNAVEITFTPSEQVEWTKYTTDGSVPDETNGLLYTEPFTLSETTTLKWRSQDRQGNIEPVNQAVFTITKESQEAVFDNDKHKDGYIRANADGSGRSIGTFSHLALGVSSDGKINRAILHFDTALIPDNATLTRAFLQVKYFSGLGDPWSGENQLVVDVNKGYFGSSLSLQTDDWDAPATAEAVATIEQFAGGSKNSSDFYQTGLNAINLTGITQVRLRFEPNPSGTYKYVFLKQGAEAKLFVEYTI